MPSLGEISTAGGWAVFTLGVFWLAIALQRRWIVPGWIFDSEREQRMKAEEWAERNSQSLALMAKAADDARRARTSRRSDDA